MKQWLDGTTSEIRRKLRLSNVETKEDVLRQRCLLLSLLGLQDRLDLYRRLKSKCLCPLPAIEAGYGSKWAIRRVQVEVAHDVVDAVVSVGMDCNRDQCLARLPYNKGRNRGR